MQERRETAQRELATLASRSESLEAFERDKDKLLESYATLAPEALVAFARRFGATADPLVRQRLVDAHIRYELLRFLRYRSQTALSQGRRPGAEASVMKLAFARYMQALTRTAIDAQGAHGLLGGDDVADDGMWLRRFLHSPSLRIAGGSDQVQANIMGERALGLPAEPRADKDVPFRELSRRVG